LFIRENGILLQAFFFFKAKTMPSCGKKNFHGGQVSAFYAKDQAGTGKSGFPGNFEVFALQAVRRPIRGIGRLSFYITHYYLTV
jgi:hypothetical protein